MFDGRSSAHFTDYGIDVREELRTDDDDGRDGRYDDIDSSPVTATGAEDHHHHDHHHEGLQSISIKSRLEVSNLINADPIGQQQQEGESGGERGMLTGQVEGSEEKEVAEEGENRKSTSLLDALDQTAAASSTPIVNHFAGGGEQQQQQPQLPSNMDRNNSRGGGGGVGVGDNEYLSSRNYSSSDISGSSWSINNKSVFNENTRVGASSATSSFSSSSFFLGTSPEHDTSSSTTTTLLTATPKTITPPTPLRPCKYGNWYCLWLCTASPLTLLCPPLASPAQLWSAINDDG